MKKRFLLFASCAAILTGCQLSEILPGVSRELKTFTGTIAEQDTRATLVSDGSIYHVTWKEGDRILINNLPFDATVGDVTTTFFVQDTTGANPDEPPTGPYTAVYPTTVSRGLPGVQNYVPNNVEFIPMTARSENESLVFKNMVGLLKLNIKTGETGIVVKRIVIKADQPLSGEYEMEGDAAKVSGTEGVILNCGEGVAIGADPIPFLVTVPAGTYTGMSVKVFSTDGKMASVKMKAASSITVERSKVYEAEFPFNGFSTPDGLGGTAQLPSGTDFNSIIKQVATGDELASATTVDDTLVTRIVFNNLCPDTDGIEIHDLTSEKPIYLVYDKTSGVVNINSPAEKFLMAEDASYMFARFGSLKAIDNLKCVDTDITVDMSRMFYFISNTVWSLEEIDLSNFNTSNVTTMLSMFNGCRALRHIDLSSFNTENVEDISYMFQYCKNLEHIDLSSFNTENVYTMRNIFTGCDNLRTVDLSSFDTENCTDMQYFFSSCYSLEAADLSSFHTENCTDFYNFFYRCRSITDIKIPNFSFESATDIRHFFDQCESLQVIDVSMLDGSHMTKNNGWFFYHDKSLREIYAGDTFNIGKTNAFIDNYDGWEFRAGSVFGSLTIFCNQDVANYFTTTALRWINSGYHGSYDPVAPIPVYFKDFKTGSPINVEWPSN